MSAAESTFWYDEGCGEEYLTVYRHRDETEARVVADLIRSHVSCAPGAPALDVGCGVGRHVRFLNGYQWTVGVDISASLLHIANKTVPGASLVRADMRSLPFRSGVFGLVVNLFTSFGYFGDDAQNHRVIAEIARVTAPGGWFVLDFLNAMRVRRTLVNFDRQKVGSVVIEQRRQISTDGNYVQKVITVVGAHRSFRERVRLFDQQDLAAMLGNYGFAVRQTLGDYQGGPGTPDSPRAILISQRCV